MQEQDLNAQSATPSKQEEYDALMAEISQTEESLENGFAAFMANATNNELEDLFFEDREAFYKKVLEEQNKWLNDNLYSKQERANQLQDEILNDAKIEGMQIASEEFMRRHPEVDMAELMDFYQNEIPPRLRAEIDAMEPLEQFETILRLLEEAKGKGDGAKNGEKGEENAQKEPKKERKDEPLPQQINGVGSDLTIQGGEYDLPTRRY